MSLPFRRCASTFQYSNDSPCAALTSPPNCPNLQEYCTAGMKRCNKFETNVRLQCCLTLIFMKVIQTFILFACTYVISSVFIEYACFFDLPSILFIHFGIFFMKTYRRWNKDVNINMQNMIVSCVLQFCPPYIASLCVCAMNGRITAAYSPISLIYEPCKFSRVPLYFFFYSVHCVRSMALYYFKANDNI